MAQRPKTPRPTTKAPKLRTFRIRIPFELSEVHGDIGGPSEEVVRLSMGHITLDFSATDSLDVPVRVTRTLERLFGAKRSVAAFHG